MFVTAHGCDPSPHLHTHSKKVIAGLSPLLGFMFAAVYLCKVSCFVQNFNDSGASLLQWKRNVESDD